MIATAESNYTGVAKLLHWAVAALIITQYILAKMAEAAAESEQLPSQLLLLANHKSVGMSILILASLRLLWRLRHKPPALPEAMPSWERRCAVLAHWLLYGLIFALPLSGWLLSSASAYSVSWFGLFQWPDLVSASPSFKEQLVNLHHLLAKVLIVVVLIHVLAAVKHHFIDHDAVLKRMLSGAALGVFAVLLAGGIWGLGIAATNAKAVAPATVAATLPATESPSVAASSMPLQPVQSALALWDIDYKQSEIRFIGEQAGARFEGTWQSWQAEIRFDPNHLQQSHARVVVAADSADSADAERDSTLSSEAWFAAASYPQVVYRTDRIHAYEEQGAAENAFAFRAEGVLQVKGLQVPVPLSFNLTQDGERLTLNGAATLDRIALNLGTGEWQDPAAVGHRVQVQVTVVATIPP